MKVRSGDGEKLGHVESVEAEGFRIGDGPFVMWDELIEVREDEVFVSTHRPDLGEQRQASPRE